MKDSQKASDEESAFWLEPEHSLFRLIRQINSKPLVKEFISRDGLESVTILRKDPRFGSRAPVLLPVFEDKMDGKEGDLTLPSSPAGSDTLKSPQSPGFDILANYTIGHRLGQGVNSTVWHAIHEPTNTECALKTYTNNEEVKARVLRETNVLKSTKHPNIIRFLAKIDTPKTLYVVIECVEGKTLSRYLRSKPGLLLSEREAKPLFSQIVSATVYCHQHNICHRDLKLDNILVTNNHEVKIVDFGFATCRPHSQKSTVFCGTPHYMAPEILSGEGYTGPPVDIWALGVILYFMLVGRYPFDGVNETEIFTRVRRTRPNIPSMLSSKARDFLAKILEPNPLKRLTAKQLQSHKWLNAEFTKFFEVKGTSRKH